MNVLTQAFSKLVLNSGTTTADSGADKDMTIIESLIGIDIPDYVLWIVIGAIVVIAIALVAWGFFKEVNKK